MPTTTSIAPLESAAQVASGVGSVVDLGAHTTAELVLDVSAISGTLTVSVESARSETASAWIVAGDFGATTATKVELKTFAGLSQYARVRWTLTGSATFSVLGESVLVYCTPADMKRVIQSRGLVKDQNVSFTDADLDGFAQDAGDEAEGSLGAMFTLPLSAWGRDVRRKVAELAVFYAMEARGFNPEDPGGALYVKMYDSVQKWLGLVRDQKIELQHCVDATPEIEDGGAYVVTSPSRGWGV
jgi:carbon monoxide dehydrogenase subunit G